ncbi:MAG: hypothetical protein LBT40_02260 [Deltaproteobacteria bacterium]|jgi:hypothetical protein|nr:hypothetical protein [Deltaproteobacteria bacterium]
MLWVLLVVAAVIVLAILSAVRYMRRRPLYRVLLVLASLRREPPESFAMRASVDATEPVTNDATENINRKCQEILLDTDVMKAFDQAARLADENSRMKGMLNMSGLLGGDSGGGEEGTGGSSGKGDDPFLRSIHEKDAVILNRLSRVSRRLERDGVELSAEELSELTLTLTGRDVMESVSAIAIFCGIGQDVCWMNSRSGKRFAIAQRQMVFLISLLACWRLVASACIRIRGTYLPRLDAALARGGALAAMDSAASGPENVRRSRAALRRAGEDLRLILLSHLKILSRREKLLDKVLHSLKGDVIAFDDALGTDEDADAVVSSKGCPVLPLMEAGLKKIEVHLKKPMPLPEVNFAGREHMFWNICMNVLTSPDSQ